LNPRNVSQLADRARRRSRAQRGRANTKTTVQEGSSLARGAVNPSDQSGGHMGYLTGSAFGIGTPTIPLLPQTTPWGFSPYAGQGIGGQALQPHGQTLLSPLVVGGGSSIGPYGISPVQI